MKYILHLAVILYFGITISSCEPDMCGDIGTINIVQATYPITRFFTTDEWQQLTNSGSGMEYLSITCAINNIGITLDRGEGFLRTVVDSSLTRTIITKVYFSKAESNNQNVVRDTLVRDEGSSRIRYFVTISANNRPFIPKNVQTKNSNQLQCSPIPARNSVESILVIVPPKSGLRLTEIVYSPW